MRLSARLCFHLILPAVLLPVLSLPFVWGLALVGLRQRDPAEAAWRRATLALALLDTVLAALLLAGMATGAFPLEAEALAEPPPRTTRLFEPTGELPETAPGDPWQLGAVGAFLLGVGALWIVGRRRGAEGARFWLPFLGILLATVVLASAAALALAFAGGGPSLGSMLLALAVQSTVMGALALWMRAAWRRRGRLREQAGEPLSLPPAVGLSVLYLVTGAMRLGLLVALVVALSPLEAPSPADAPLQTIARMELQPVAIALFVATVVVIGPVAEELLFRGVLVPWLATFLSPWWAAWIGGLLFALLHVHYGPFALVVALYGGILGWARLRTGGLTAPILLHVGINGSAALALFGS